MRKNVDQEQIMAAKANKNFHILSLVKIYNYILSQFCHIPEIYFYQQIYNVMEISLTNNSVRIQQP